MEYRGGFQEQGCYNPRMGFFSKFKQQLNIGGVKVKLEAPASASLNDASINVQATFTNGDSPQTIKSVLLHLYEETDPSVMGTPTSSPSQPTRVSELASNRIDQPFALQPNETKTLPFILPLNVGAFAAQNLQAGSPLATVAGTLGKLQSVGDALDGTHHRYYIEISADVDNAALNASDRVQIQLPKPGQPGGAVNFHL